MVCTVLFVGSQYYSRELVWDLKLVICFRYNRLNVHQWPNGYQARFQMLFDKSIIFLFLVYNFWVFIFFIFSTIQTIR